MFNGFNKCVHIINLDKLGNFSVFDLVGLGFRETSKRLYFFSREQWVFRLLRVLQETCTIQLRINGNFFEVSEEFTNEEQGRKLTCIFPSENLLTV